MSPSGSGPGPCPPLWPPRPVTPATPPVCLRPEPRDGRPRGWWCFPGLSAEAAGLAVTAGPPHPGPSSLRLLPEVAVSLRDPCLWGLEVVSPGGVWWVGAVPRVAGFPDASRAASLGPWCALRCPASAPPPAPHLLRPLLRTCSASALHLFRCAPSGCTPPPRGVSFRSPGPFPLAPHGHLSPSALLRPWDRVRLRRPRGPCVRRGPVPPPASALWAPSPVHSPVCALLFTPPCIPPRHGRPVPSAAARPPPVALPGSPLLSGNPGHFLCFAITRRAVMSDLLACAFVGCELFAPGTSQK